MSYITCPDCDAQVSNFATHRCSKSSGGGVESRHARLEHEVAAHDHAIVPAEAGVAPGPPEAIPERSQEAKASGVDPDIASSILAAPARKRGRPKLGEIRDRPWEDAGMSRTTWYRRQKELVR